VKMDTCMWVIGVGVLKLNRNSVGPGEGIYRGVFQKFSGRNPIETDLD